MNKIENNTESCLYMSDEVITKTVSRAACSVSGVAAIAKAPADPIKLLAGKTNCGKIKIKLNGDVLFVSIAVVLKEGVSAVETAERVQSTIKSAVQNTLGMAVARVDVKIVDIEV